jgi:PPOX class probable FMN-dependent enzyme
MGVIENPAEHHITDIAALERLYDQPLEPPIAKEVGYVHPHYAQFIKASPFAVLATSGPEGLDASPRGDHPGFVAVEDEKTLLLPDRRGNNRIDSLRNIVRDPRVALIFLIPGVNETLRVFGRAVISTDPKLLERFVVEQRAPKTVIVVHVESVYFQCARAMLRSKLWDASRHIERSALPSNGTILAALTKDRIDGAKYDSELRGRLTTLY